MGTGWLAEDESGPLKLRLYSLQHVCSVEIYTETTKKHALSLLFRQLD